MLAAAAGAAGRAARATWLMLARGAGSTARSVGRAREIDPGHRRDGIALGLMALAIVIAAASWFDAARPVGAWIDSMLRTFVGGAVVLLPLLIGTAAVILMRTEPYPEARPRLVLGSAMIGLPVLGLWHLWTGAPTDPAARQRAGGFIGFAIGGPLSDGLTAWIATPLLIGAALFGLLVARFVGEETLNRFYVLHCIAIPLATALLTAIHFWRVRKDGGISGPL